MLAPLRLSLFTLLAGALIWGVPQAPLHAQQVGSGAVGGSSDGMDEIRWGWSRKQVYKHFAAKILASYQAKFAAAEDAIEEDRLRYAMRDELRRIRESYVVFDGRTSAHDGSFLSREYTHNNHEAMLVVALPKSEDYFFFINNRLWKRYRALKNRVFGEVAFAEVGQALEGHFGAAQKHRAHLYSEEESTDWYEWRKGRTRARAIDNSANYGFYSLVFEDMRTVANLSKLRKNKPPTKQHHKSVVDAVIEQEEGPSIDANSDIADRISSAAE